MKESICDVCEKNEMVGMACVPGIPYTAAYCIECLKANAHPWKVLVVKVAEEGGLDKVHPGFKDMVECTCKHLGRTIKEFNMEVEKNI